MAAITVTATQGGVTKNGMILRVRVLVGSDTAANIAAGTCKGTQSAAAAHSIALTTTRAGSVVWCAMENGNAGANNPSAGNSSLDDVPDATNAQQYGTIFQTTPTVTPGAFTSGSADSFPGGAASLEILPAISGGTISYDASGPALASTTAATTVTTASFTPPAGTVLMALVSSAGGTGVVTMALSDSSGLVWTPVVEAHATSEQYAGIWLATVPSGTVGRQLTANPGKTWKRRYWHVTRELIQFPILQVAGATAQETVNAESATATAVVTIPGSTAQLSITAPAGTPVATVVGTTAAVSVSAIAGTPTVTLLGPTANVTVNAESAGAGVVLYQAAVPIANPGPAWLRVFRDNRRQQTFNPAPQTLVTGVTASVTVAAESATATPQIAIQGVTAQVSIAAIAGTPVTTVVGTTAQETVNSVAGTPVITIIGATAQANVNAETGSVAMFAPATARAQPGAAWLRVFQYNRRQQAFSSVAPTPTTTVIGVTANVTVNAETGSVLTIPQSPVPVAYPGPSWLRRYRHRQFDFGLSIPPVRHPLALGGTEADENLYGGTVDFDLFDGTAVADRFDGLADFDFIDGTGVTTTTTIFAGTANDENTYGGVPDFDFLDGTQIGWTMQAQNITLGEFNDESIDVAITQNASAFNLTGFSLRAYFKVAAGDLDSAGTTLTLSSVGGGAPITITNTAGGLATIVIAKVNLQNANFTFWRVDVVNTGTSLQNTAIYGTVTTRLL